MKMRILAIGNHQHGFVAEAVEYYHQRLKHYCDLELRWLQLSKSQQHKNIVLQKEQESQLIEKQLQAGDWVVLLDERGQNMHSKQLASNIEKWQAQSQRRINWVIGGAYGFDDDLRKRANLTLRLSDFTFSHQLARIVLMEQLYRAYTILSGHPYHHE